MLLVKNVCQDHTGSRHDGHEQKKFHNFPVGGAVHHIADGGKLVRFRDQIPGGLVLQIRDLIGISRNTENDVGQVRQQDDERRSHFGKEGTQRRDDGLFPLAELVFVVFHRVDDGDHHDEIVAVLAEVGQCIACHHDPELHHARRQEECRDEHQSVAHHSDARHDLHEILPVDLPGNGRIEDHQKCRGEHADDTEGGEESSFVSVIKVDVGCTQAADDETVADLLDQEDQCNPFHLIVLRQCLNNFSEVERLHFRRLVISMFPNTEDGKGQEQRCQDAGDEGDGTVGRCRVSSNGIAADGIHGDQNGSQSSADTGTQGGTGGELVPTVGVRRQRRDQSPVGDVVHGVGNTVQEINDPEEPHEAPSLQIRIKGQVHHHGRGDDADDEPGLEFAPPCSRLFNDISHDGVVQSVKDTGCHHDGRNGSELRIGQGPGKQDEGHEAVGKQIVDGVPPDGAHGKQDQVSF